MVLGKGQVLVLVIVLYPALLPLFYCNSYECTIVKIIVHFCVTLVTEVFLEFFSPIGGNLVPRANLVPSALFSVFGGGAGNPFPAPPQKPEKSALGTRLDWRLAPSLAEETFNWKISGTRVLLCTANVNRFDLSSLSYEFPLAPTSVYPTQLNINCKGPQTKISKDVGSIYRRPDQQKYIPSGKREWSMQVDINLFIKIRFKSVWAVLCSLGIPVSRWGCFMQRGSVDKRNVFFCNSLSRNKHHHNLTSLLWLITKAPK